MNYDFLFLTPTKTKEMKRKKIEEEEEKTAIVIPETTDTKLGVIYYAHTHTHTLYVSPIMFIFKRMKQFPSPRVFTTHLHYDKLPESLFKNKAKVSVLASWHFNLRFSMYRYWPSELCDECATHHRILIN